MNFKDKGSLKLRLVLHGNLDTTLLKHSKTTIYT